MITETIHSLSEAHIVSKAKELVGNDAFCWLLIYKDESFQAGIVRDGIITLGHGTYSPEHIDELRLFSSQREWHVWADGNGFKGRMTPCEITKPEHTHDEPILLVGSAIKSTQDAFELIDPSTGCRWSLPSMAFAAGLDEHDLPLQLLVRNYYDFDDNGRLVFNDARLVSINPVKKGA